MPNVRETLISGESYTRAHRIIVENKLGDAPHVTFLNERILNINGESISLDAGSMTVYFDQTKEFPLIDPRDDTPLGANGSHSQFQVLLYSLYVNAINEQETARSAG